MLKFTNKQIEKLSDLFLDLAKGSFLAALGLPILIGADMVVLFKLFIHGMILTYFSSNY